MKTTTLTCEATVEEFEAEIRAFVAAHVDTTGWEEIWATAQARHLEVEDPESPCLYAYDLDPSSTMGPGEVGVGEELSYWWGCVSTLGDQLIDFFVPFAFYLTSLEVMECANVLMSRERVGYGAIGVIENSVPNLSQVMREWALAAREVLDESHRSGAPSWWGAPKTLACGCL